GHAEIRQLAQVLHRGHVGEDWYLMAARFVDDCRPDLRGDLGCTPATTFHPDLDEIHFLRSERAYRRASFLRRGRAIDLHAHRRPDLRMGKAVAAGIDARTGDLAVAEIVHRHDRISGVCPCVADCGDAPAEQHRVVFPDVLKRSGIVAVHIDQAGDDYL